MGSRKMSEKQYVRAVLKKICCSGRRKKEIEKQITSDLKFRLSRGEKLSDIISDMGTPEEIADGFRDSIPLKEQKAAKLAGRLKIILPIVAVILVIVMVIAFMMPRTYDLENSGYFRKADVEAWMEKTVALFDTNDAEALRQMSIPEMSTVFDEKTMQQVKTQISDDWGARQSFGAAYVVGLSQRGRHYAMGEITVNYENVTVIYRLTYDEEGKLAGLYVR